MRTRRAAAAGLVGLALGAAGLTSQVTPGFAAADQVPPVVLTGQAGGVAQNTATLGATIDTEGSETVYEFDFGADTSYGTRIFGDAGSEPGEQTFSSALQGLAPGTTYHYRIVATNAAGTTYGADQTFTTTTYPSAALVATPVLPLVPTPVLRTASSESTTSSGSTAAAAAHVAGAATAAHRSLTPTRRSRKGRSRFVHAHGADRKGRR